MEFTELCEAKLLENINNVDAKFFHGRPYFHIEHILQLAKVLQDINLIDDLGIEAYYIHGRKRLELQDYSLSIRVVNAIKPKEMYFLAITEKSRLDEIDSTLLDLLDNTYYEVQLGDIQTFVKCLNKYVNFISERQTQLLWELRSSSEEHTNDDGIFFKLL